MRSSGGDSTSRELTLMERCLAGEASAAERAELSGLLGEGGEKIRTVAGLLQSGEESMQWDTAARLRVLHERLGLQNEDGIAKGVHPMSARVMQRGLRADGGGARLGTRTLRRKMWYGIAGLFVSALGVIVGWQEHTRHGVDVLSGAVSTYMTASGERANITLPDGSTVALNVASRLDVPADFVMGHRTVRLVGEGLFTVPHYAGQAFTVVTGRTSTHVLGTSFLVRHYATDRVTTVAVRDGKVMVQAQALQALTKSQRMDISQTGVMHVGVADPAQFSFATGVLTLDRVPFPAAIAELDRWYDADIRLGDPALAKRRVAGEYAAGSIAELTDILALTFNVRVVRAGRVLTLFSR